MLPTGIHRNTTTVQLFSKRNKVLLSCVKGMPLSSGGDAGPYFQESWKDHPQSHRSERFTVQCFLLGILNNFLLTVHRSPPERSKSSCALDRRCRSPNSGMGSIQGSEVSIYILSRPGFSRLPENILGAISILLVYINSSHGASCI